MRNLPLEFQAEKSSWPWKQKVNQSTLQCLLIFFLPISQLEMIVLLTSSTMREHWGFVVWWFSFSFLLSTSVLFSLYQVNINNLFTYKCRLTVFSLHLKYLLALFSKLWANSRNPRENISWKWSEGKFLLGRRNPSLNAVMFR